MPRSTLPEAVIATLLILCAGCGAMPGQPLPNESTQPVDTDRFELLARFVHITDAQIVDEESPGRLAIAASLTRSAWRPYEAYSVQLLDGIIRTVNKLHVARHTIDFLVFTGDATDNAQLNELEWFITVLDGGRIDPRTGPDDRDPALRPDPLLDPHYPFEAQGLHRSGVHGDAPTIEWYGMLGNHDRFAVGVFPIVTDVLGRRTSPLPLEDRIGIFLPVELDPTGRLSWGAITPANPGPPSEINLPVLVPANPARRFITDREFMKAHLTSITEPRGHGFAGEGTDRTWYSVSCAPGLRLIALNSASPFIEEPGLIYSEGAISFAQRLFLQRELERAQALGEYVIVATHHPSGALEPVYGTALTPRTFRTLLNRYPCVKLHLAGHWHRNVVIDRGSYVEIVTGSTLDAPQQGRIIEIWRNSVLDISPIAKRFPTGLARAKCQGSARADDPTPSDEIEVRYWTFSHLEEIDPPDDSQADIFHDPLMPMRRVAAELAGVIPPEPRASARADQRQ